MNETHPSIDQIVDYLHGELAAAEDAAMHAHLAGCPSCDERRAEEASITETLRAHARAGELEFPPGLATKIQVAAKKPQSVPLLERLSAGFRPVWILPAIAAAALILYFGFGTRQGGPLATTIDPSFYEENHAVMAASAPFAQDGAPVVLTSNDETP